jgi:hypothetical protein
VSGDFAASDRTGRDDFRIVELSVQHAHLHLIVEADELLRRAWQQHGFIHPGERPRAPS